MLTCSQHAEILPHCLSVSILRLLILQPCCHAGKVLPDAGQPANGQLITTAAGQQCLPLNMIRKPDGKLDFLGITLGQVGKVATRVGLCTVLPSSEASRVLRLHRWHHDSMTYQ